MLKISPRRAAKLTSLSESGFLLPMVVITGLIIAAGITATATRAYTGWMASIRQGQSKQAQQAAETGLNIIIKELNEKYPYLLISHCAVGQTYVEAEDCAGWKVGGSDDNLQLETSKCPTAEPDPSGALNLIKGDIKNQANNTKARYQLINYNFTGDSQQGGEALIRVMGEAIVGGSTKRAMAVIEQTIPILPKNCNVPINAPSNGSTFAGLLATGKINLRNNNVGGSVNANIYGFNCDPSLTRTDLEACIGANSPPTGEIFGGAVNLPTVPSFPGEPITDFVPLVIKNTIDIVAGTPNPPSPGKKSCFLDADGVTHCRVKCISLAGGDEIRVWNKPGTGPLGGPIVPSNATKGIRLYFDYKNDEIDKADSVIPKANSLQNEICAGSMVLNMQGTSTNLYQKTYNGTTASPVDLAIFGLERPSAGGYVTQTFSIGGGAKISAFMYIPNASFGFQGGMPGNNEVTGAVWTHCYLAGTADPDCGGPTVGSGSTNANIFVPPDMGELLFKRFGIEFVPAIREFVAVGSTRWQLYQVPSN